MAPMEISELVRVLLVKRGITNANDIAAFLSPDYDLHTHAPELFSGMDAAVSRVLKAIECNERIAVYADFDCDGIPGASVLADFFEKIGYANVETYLPHRDREGYGFHTDAIALLASRGVKLIITVDVGTTAVEAVRFAREKGVDVIVTDHHEIPGTLPDAVAVLNPKIAPYPFPNLCGAAVAFKLAQATLSEGKRRGIPSFVSTPDGWEKWLLDLVAIATVADMVPLVGENRVLAYWGLEVLHKSQRLGINALCNALRLRKSELTEDDIGFSIAPRINAASRMDEPDLAFRLLTTKNADEAEKLAAHLEELNARRKGVAGAIVRAARMRVRERFGNGEPVIVLGDPEWKPALLGLAANSIVEDRGGVVCLWGRDANGKLKGSCRSDGSISVVELFSAAGDALDEYGGHEMSGGFSVSHDHVHTLHASLEAAAKTISVRDSKTPDVRFDVQISLPEISWALFKDVSRLAPFGTGNEKPVFLLRGARVASARSFGKEKNHAEVTLSCEGLTQPVRGFQFFTVLDDFSLTPEVGTRVDVLATLERDSFRGPARLALRIVDIIAPTA